MGVNKQVRVEFGPLFMSAIQYQSLRVIFNHCPAFVKTFFELESMPARPLKLQGCLENDTVWQNRSYNMFLIMLAKATTRGLSLQIHLTSNIRTGDYLVVSKDFRDIVTAPLGGYAMNRGRWFDIQRRRKLLQDVKAGYISDVQFHWRKRGHEGRKAPTWNLTVNKKTGGLRPGELAKLEKHCSVLKGDCYWSVIASLST